MAFGYAVALLRDLQQAEDVVQEAFVAAWFGLRSLADPRYSARSNEMATVWHLADETKVRSRILALNREIAKVNARATEGPPTRLGPLDVEAIVAEWRARRKPG